MSYNIPQPGKLQFTEWGARVAEELAAYSVAPPQFNETRWKEWAQSLQTVQQLSGLSIPSTSGFKDWREWGERLVGILR